MSCLFGGVELVPETGRELVAFSDLTIQGLYCIYIHTYIYISNLLITGAQEPLPM